MRAPGLIQIPFATSGDMTPIPNTAQPDGSVSFPTGWGPDYAKNKATDPTAKNVERTAMNWILNLVTQHLRRWQLETFPEWVSPSDNGGTAVTYQPGAVVMYAIGANPLKAYIARNATTTAPLNGGGTVNTDWAVFSDLVTGALLRTGDTATGIINLTAGATTTSPPDGNNSTRVPTTEWLRKGYQANFTNTQQGYIVFAKNLGGLQMNYGYTTFDALGQTRVVTLMHAVTGAQLGVNVTEYSEVSPLGVANPLVISGRFLSNTQLSLQVHNSTGQQPSAGVFWTAWSTSA